MMSLDKKELRKELELQDNMATDVPFIYCHSLYRNYELIEIRDYFLER